MSDGSARNYWFLTEEDCKQDIERELEEYNVGWGEDCIECVETFVGSDIYQEAVKNSEEIRLWK